MGTFVRLARVWSTGYEERKSMVQKKTKAQGSKPFSEYFFFRSTNYRSRVVLTGTGYKESYAVNFRTTVEDSTEVTSDESERLCLRVDD